MNKLHLKFIMMLFGLSALGLGILRVMTGEVDAAMAYAIAVIAGYSAGTWYGKASRELNGKSQAGGLRGRDVAPRSSSA